MTTSPNPNIPRCDKCFGEKRGEFCDCAPTTPTPNTPEQFKECFECAKKPGIPKLCPQCLWARDNWPPQTESGKTNKIMSLEELQFADGRGEDRFDIPSPQPPAEKEWEKESEVQEWKNQGRTPEQVYGMANFLTGAGGRMI